MKNSETIVTERLILRKPKISDAEPMFKNWASDKEVTKYLTWPAHESVEVTKQTINRWLQEEDNPQTIRFIITIKGNDEPIGSIDVVGYQDDAPEIGYCLSRKHWNKGYMSEACKAFMNHLFERGFKRIIIAAALDNIASNRVIEKCGFKFTHIEHREHTSIFKEEPVDINWYEIRKL